MTALPDDIKDGIIKLAEITEIPTKSLMERLKEIVKTDENIQSMEKDDFKVRYAWALLYREHSMAGKTTDFYVMPICQPRSREIKIKGEETYVGDLSALVIKLEKNDEGNITKGDTQYASGTFWREGAKNIGKLIVGKVYKSSLIAKDNNWGVEITSDRAGFLPVEEKMCTIDEFYKKEIKPLNKEITIGEMDLNKADSATDIRVMEATVIEATVGESNDGNEYGRYTIMDASVMGSNFAIFVDPKDVVWSQGSILIFGGTVDIDKNTEVVRWKSQFILPTELAMPMQVIVKPVTEKPETVDVSVDTTPEEPGKTEETTEESKKEDESKTEEKNEEKTKEKKDSTDDTDFEI